MRTSLRPGSRGNGEKGIVILLVAVFMLFVVGAMAALAIDVVTLYTARSEAQLAADAAALAGARVLANSGITSQPGGGLVAAADTLAQGVAIQVAEQNPVGGTNLTAANIVSVVFGGTETNPTITVKVQKTDLPTFFARIWRSTPLTVGASATAEAYNPSIAVPAPGVTATPVAPICVKPWLLPNIDPSNKFPAPIFDRTSGSIATPTLLGWSFNTATTGKPMSFACGVTGTCTTPLPAPASWNYYPGDDATTFSPPPTSVPTCSMITTLSNYQKSIVGCFQTPISCSSPPGTPANIDLAVYAARNSDTADAVNCLTHSTTNNGDTVTTTSPPSAPFEFVAGADNPIAGLAPSDVMVSDSLVTVPVFDINTFNPKVPSVQIIGFVQLFLNPDGNAAPDTGPASGNVNTTVINLAGCGTSATGNPIIGNGASPVAVRLISPP